MNRKIQLAGMTLSDLEEFFSSLNEPEYRAQQVFHWIYCRNAASFSEMKNLPRPLRIQLEQLATIHTLTQVRVTGSEQEPTRKFLFRLSSGEMIESVLMRSGKRTTVCLSTQAGCALDCTFCATASMGFQKNLSTGEIIGQFLLIQHNLADRITNVVFMGMGEPFLNYRAVIRSANMLNDPSGMNLGARRITISTAGIIPKIRKFADEKQRYKLAISLNGTTQEQRLRTMPVAKTYPLNEVITAAHYYYQRTGKQLTFEYILMQGVNSDPTDARQLKQLLVDLPCKVNLIPYNEIGGEFHAPSEDQISTFLEILTDAPFVVTVRRSKGTGINAGCGQLAGQTQGRLE